MAREDDIGNRHGTDAWDIAADSYASCPCCDAKARLRHVEPRSGGGLSVHAHRCTRCRHEWEAEPATWRLCRLPGCDAHGLDATSLGGHLDMIELALDMRSPVSGEVIGRVMQDFGLAPSAGSDPQTCMAAVRAARRAVGGGTALAAAWFHNLNTALADTPANIMSRTGGADRLLGYLASRQAPIDE